jgi:hypothetical protein
MLAYLQDIDADQALAEVNSQASGNGLSAMTIRRRSADALVELDHHLDRPFPDSPFLLMHLWTRVTA